MGIYRYDGTDFVTRDAKPEGDIDVICEVFKNDTYNLRKLAAVLNPKTIIDVGAHIGTFTVLAKQVWPEAKVIAVEPNGVSYDLLVQNTGQLDGVTCINAAMRYDGSDILTDGFKATGGGYMADEEKLRQMDRAKYYVAYEHVKLVTIEQIMAEHGIESIDILKLDCEGSERDMFKSISDDAAGKITHLLGECHMRSQELVEYINAKWPGKNLWMRKGNPTDTIGNFWAMAPCAATMPLEAFRQVQ